VKYGGDGTRANKITREREEISLNDLKKRRNGPRSAGKLELNEKELRAKDGQWEPKGEDPQVISRVETTAAHPGAGRGQLGAGAGSGRMDRTRAAQACAQHGRIHTMWGVVPRTLGGRRYDHIAGWSRRIPRIRPVGKGDAQAVTAEERENNINEDEGDIPLLIRTILSAGARFRRGRGPHPVYKNC